MKSINSNSKALVHKRTIPEVTSNVELLLNLQLFQTIAKRLNWRRFILKGSKKEDHIFLILYTPVIIRLKKTWQLRLSKTLESRPFVHFTLIKPFEFLYSPPKCITKIYSYFECCEPDGWQANGGSAALRCYSCQLSSASEKKRKGRMNKTIIISKMVFSFWVWVPLFAGVQTGVEQKKWRTSNYYWVCLYSPSCSLGLRVSCTHGLDFLLAVFDVCERLVLCMGQKRYRGCQQ